MPDFDPHIDYYEILQVHPQAHQEVIKHAYRTILRLLQSHPDLGGTHEDALRINEAYRILSHTELRRAYDEARARLQTTRLASESPYAKHTMSSPPHSPHLHKRDDATCHDKLTIVRCPRCGKKNRIKDGQRENAVCGHCSARLYDNTRNHHESPVAISSDQLQLSPPLRRRLQQHGEIRLKQTKAHLHHFSCVRCGYRWTVQDGVLPHNCPQCHSPNWHSLRIFRCRYCRRNFTSYDITSWPYALFSHCPVCRTPHWHAGCEKHPLRWLYNLFIRY